MHLNKMRMSSENLLKLKGGDHAIFNTIYEDWNRKVFYYFLQKTNDQNAAQELTQQTFIKFWKYRSLLSIELTIDQQLFQKARLIFIDWLRKEATYRKYFSQDIENAQDANLHTETNTDFRHHVENSLKSLSPKRRKVFELKHIHGYSYKEIAEFMGITVKTVDNHLLKATSQLKKVLNL